MSDIGKQFASKIVEQRKADEKTASDRQDNTVRQRAAINKIADRIDVPLQKQIEEFNKEARNVEVLSAKFARESSTITVSRSTGKRIELGLELERLTIRDTTNEVGLLAGTFEYQVKPDPNNQFAFVLRDQESSNRPAQSYDAGQIVDTVFRVLFQDTPK